MLWKKFPFPNSLFVYSPTSLENSWARLHANDAEPFPHDSRLVEAWIAFHSGEFNRAIDLGLAVGVEGYSVANKANCIYANYLENKDERKLAFYLEISSRCDVQKSLFPDVAAAYFWQAYVLWHYAQSISIVRALAEGVAGKVLDCLNKTIELAPSHADAYIALGMYHAEIVSNIGARDAEAFYRASKEEAVGMFQKALLLHPQSALARIEYANYLIRLYGTDKMEEAFTLYRDAAAIEPQDALERLDMQLAMDELVDD